MAYTPAKNINTWILILALSTSAAPLRIAFAEETVKVDSLSTAVADSSAADAEMLATAESAVGVRVLVATDDVTSEHIFNAAHALAQRQDLIKNSPFQFKKIMVSKNNERRTKSRLFIDGSKEIKDIVAFIDSAYAEMKRLEDERIEKARQAEILAQAQADLAEKVAAEKKKIIDCEAPLAEGATRHLLCDPSILLEADSEFSLTEEESLLSQELLAEAANWHKFISAPVVAAAAVATADEGSATSTVGADGESIYLLSKMEVSDQQVNTLPVAMPKHHKVIRGQEVRGKLSATDMEDNVRNLRFKKVSDPTHGQLLLKESTGEYQFVPEKNFVGATEFGVVAVDGDGGESVAVNVNMEFEKPGPVKQAQTDRFANPRQRVNLVFVIDNSASMAGSQATLGQAFTKFIPQFDKLNLDYHIGVLSTDNPTNVGTKENPRYINGNIEKKLANGKVEDLVYGELVQPFLRSTMYANDKDPAAKRDMAFQSIVNLGINGSSEETALLPMIYFFSPEAMATSRNKNFMRQDAVTVFFIVSDEDEHRAYPGMNGKVTGSRDKERIELNQRLDQLEAAFKRVAGPQGRMKVYAITTKNGYAFRAAAARFGGTWTGKDGKPVDFIDISKDFSADLVRAGEEAAKTAAFQRALSYKPVEGVVKAVRLNGVSLQPTDYTYDAEANVVKLQGAAAERSIGGTIEVDYDWMFEAKD